MSPTIEHYRFAVQAAREGEPVVLSLIVLYGLNRPGHRIIAFVMAEDVFGSLPLHRDLEVTFDPEPDQERVRAGYVGTLLGSHVMTDRDQEVDCKFLQPGTLSVVYDGGFTISHHVLNLKIPT